MASVLLRYFWVRIFVPYAELIECWYTWEMVMFGDVSKFIRTIYRFSCLCAFIADLHVHWSGCEQCQSKNRRPLTTIIYRFLCVVVANANWKLHRAPLLWPLIFGFYWNWNKNQRKRTTMEETLSETHYFLWTPADIRLTTQQSHTRTKKKGERRMTIYFSLFSTISFEMVKLAPVVDCAPGKSLFYLSHEMCVHQWNRWGRARAEPEPLWMLSFVWYN